MTSYHNYLALDLGAESGPGIKLGHPGWPIDSQGISPRLTIFLDIKLAKCYTIEIRWDALDKGSI